MKSSITGLARRVGLTRGHLAAARMCCERNVFARVPQATNRKVGRILCYHSVGQPEWGVNDVSPAQFRRHIQTALEAGFRFVPASRIVENGGDPRELAITFDDGLRSVLTNAAPILEEYRVPWSLFVVSDWSDGVSSLPSGTILDWREIERVAAAGAEIGSHSVTHPNFGLIERTQIEDELGRSRRTIAERTGIDASTFAIPLGQSKNWTSLATEAARGAGYRVVYAQAEDTRPGDTVPRTFVSRFDGLRIFRALLGGAFDRWEEWV